MDDEMVTLIIDIEHYFSMACSMLICFSFLRFEDLRTRGFTFVFFLSICDAMANLTYTAFPSPDDEAATCYAQAIVISFFVASSVLWSLVISLTIYSTVLAALGRPASKLGDFVGNLKALHATVWGLSAVLAFMPLTTHSTGADAGPICWLRVDTFWGNIWLFVTAYGLIWVTIVITILTTLRVRWEINALFSMMTEASFSSVGSTAHSSKTGYLKMIEFYNTLKWYPLILIIAWTPSTIVRIYEIAGGNIEESGIANKFKLVTGMFLQGFLNAAAYGFTPAVRRKWRSLLNLMIKRSSLVPIFELEGSVLSTLRDTMSRDASLSADGEGSNGSPSLVSSKCAAERGTAVDIVELSRTDAPTIMSRSDV